ncbi:MAG: T9SS type A sorting domain-containing protein [Bacteroidia bacterium]
MNKKLLILFGAVLSFSVSALAQCTINTALTTPGYYPDSATGLPPAYITVPYSTVVQIKCPTDTTVSPYGPIHINYIQLDSVKVDSASGKHFKNFLPGFTYATNPVSGKFTNPASPSTNGAGGCVLISGTATAGQDVGGPTHNGIYPLIVYYHANVQVPVVGATNSNGTKTGYHIRVLPASAGILELTSDNFDVFQNTPNPANGRTDINYWMTSSDQVEFRVYDVLGNLITSKAMHADRGSNKYTFDTSLLSSGIYLYSIRCGEKSVSRRMIVASH